VRGGTVECGMDVRPEQLPYREWYRILIGSVGPRPIAWVSTLSKEGRPNLAPFSFFNAFSGKPPMLGFAPGLRRSDSGPSPKDTLRNVRDTGEFVVNVVTFELVEAMNLTSGEYDPTVNEFELAKIEMRASQIVKPPQVAASPVSFECKLDRIVEFGGEAPAGSLVIGEIVSTHLSETVLKDGRLDPQALDLVGRMGGIQYSRTTQRFELVRPKV
jgi:flavin reductase (DIM6/NTAB) family NADH-FMN oxidoreductase RutF